ncbi:MAG TPA: hypothetical protein GXX49_03975 [Clostridiaceae bacterium]|nr:hypothetical protein [Clostridiaceae bacterium]
MRKIYALIMIVMIFVSTLSGCGKKDKGNNVDANKNFFPVNTKAAGNKSNESIEELDKVISGYVKNNSEIKKHPLFVEFTKADPAKKVEIALGFADDMAMSCVLDFENNITFGLAAEIVKEYPHPLLLNNFGSMLAEKSREDSLYFFLKALEQDPENPVILTNAANLFIELDNFAEAESCARRALMAAPDFGPAYQVLTTIHLKNGDDILAAETMVKSAKHCFNEITIHHFESFLEAVEELNPEEDEYPLKEEFIKELYLIAKENVDTAFINDGIDTPEAQIKIQPFPKIDTINLSEISGFLNERAEEIHFTRYDVQRGYYKYQYSAEDYLNDYPKGGQGIYPIKKNLRQIYAFKVLQSYYNFKLEKCRLKYEKEMEELHSEAAEAVLKIVEEDYQEPRETTEGNYEITPMTFEELMEIQNQALERWKESLERQRNVYKGLTPRAISLSKNCYNEIKQILEEYWLRSGGILKYITNEDVFTQFDLERTITVYEYVGVALGGMLSWSSNYVDMDVSFDHVDALQSIFDALAGLSGVDAQEAEPSKSEKDEDSMVPEIEKQAISNFKEEGDLPDVGFEGDVFGVGGSISTDGERLKYSLDTPVSSAGQSKNLLYDEPWDKCYTESYFALGSKAQGSTEWFIDNSKTVKEAVGKGAKIIGNISFTGGTLEGGYICQSKDGAITDRGIIHIREVGGKIGMFGKSEIVVVKKSTITGVAIKDKSTKYKFGFGAINIK